MSLTLRHQAAEPDTLANAFLISFAWSPPFSHSLLLAPSGGQLRVQREFCSHTGLPLMNSIHLAHHVAVTGTATAAPAKRIHAGSSPARNSNRSKPGWQMRSLHPTENREEHARYVPQAPFFKLVSVARARGGFRSPPAPACRAR